MLGSFGPRESTTNRSQCCVGGDQGRVCRLKRLLLLGLHLTEKTGQTFGVMVCTVRLHVLGSYGQYVVKGGGGEGKGEGLISIVKFCKVREGVLTWLLAGSLLHSTFLHQSFQPGHH